MTMVFSHALMITGFVFVMMLTIEYINVLTSGEWRKRLARHKAGQYLLAAILGAIPGCLGAFAVVSMYSHRLLTVGAVVTAMIATSGDEAFVMFAMIPEQALMITIILLVIGVTAGIMTDFFLPTQKTVAEQDCIGYRVHSADQCGCFPRGSILQQWKELSPIRGILSLALAVFIMFIIFGQIGPPIWNWVRITLLAVSVLALFIVSTVPDHFLEDHLWNHIARQHLPRVFFWTFGALLLMFLLLDHLHLESMIRENIWIVLTLACLIGLIPESGPHLVFVTLYAKGSIPLSILLASSVVQDGHGMLPLLAHSRRAFINVKLINFATGLVIGGAGLLLGY